MQNFPFIFKILYPDVAGRELIYSGGSAKETSRVLGRIREGLNAAKLTGACQKLQLIIIETIAAAAAAMADNTTLLGPLEYENKS